MSDNVSGADNQQATLTAMSRESSETTRQTPFSRKEILAYVHGAMHDGSLNKKTRIRGEDDDIVRAVWRHME